MNACKLSLAVVICGLILSVYAFAEDDLDNAPGSMCLGTDGTLSTNTAGHIYNGTSENRTVICPSERRVIDGGFATFFKGKIWVVDESTSENVCCRSASKNPGGKLIQSEPVCSSGAKSGYQALSLPEIKDAYSWSHFYFICTLPAKQNRVSRILTYRSYQNKNQTVNVSHTLITNLPIR